MIARSRVTAQGQISVPLAVRRRLGIGPGAVLEWDEDGDRIVVRRAGRYSSQQVHQTLFPEVNRAFGVAADVDQGIRRHIKRKHASD
ncbi:MAG: AbrB/MazE/SpoVT family DNA-binding domain-containing protein [Actinomycetota bacterium]